MLKIICKKKRAGESGQALILVLVLLVLGSLFLTALLGFIGTGAKTGIIYDKKAAELYAADAGIQDATWQIRSKNIETFTGFSRYDFGATGWSYSIPPVNNENVDVTIRNVWIPSNIPTPTDVATPQGIITAGKLIVAGNTIVPGVTADDGTTKLFKYEIKIAYTPGLSEDLRINSIGLWLPPGFTYFPGDTNHKCSLTALTSPYNSSMVVTPWAGNKTWVWNFGSTPSFNSFPGYSGTPPAPVTITVTLYFIPPQDQPTLKPDAVAWITTSGVGVSDIPYSWDAGTTIFWSTAFARKGTDAGTTIDSYMAHSELPQLQTAQAGDYYATGKTMMRGVDPNANQRELLLTDNTSPITTLPTNDTVELAFLYWSGWVHQPKPNEPIMGQTNPSIGAFWDNCNNLTFTDTNCKWQSGISGSSWSLDTFGTPAEFYSRFKGHNPIGASEDKKYLEMKSNVDLTGVSTATLQWEQETSTPPTDITFRAAGTVASGTTGAISPGLPPGLVTNDMCVLVASTIAGAGGSITITTPGSITWNAMTDSPINVANGEKLYVWWGRYASGSTAPTLTPGGDHCIARIASWYNVDTSSSPIDVSAVGTEVNSDTSFSFATGLNTTANNEMCIAICSTGRDSNSAQFTNWVNNSLSSLNERMDNCTNSGGGGGFALTEGFRTTAGTVGTWTSSLSNASSKSYICFAFKPAISDTLRLAISQNGGSSWNDLGNYSSSGSYSYTLLPASGYLTSQFKMRFYVDGFDGAGEYVYLDNIGIMVTSPAITAKPADTTVKFTIQTNDGTNQTYSTTLTADPTNPDEVQSQPVVAGDAAYNSPNDGAYYGCRVDVTNLIQNYSNGADLTANPVVKGNGNATYTVADVYADCTHASDGSGQKPYDGTYGTSSYAGWSLVIIYSSPDTLGHQLYLYDLKQTFRSVPSTEYDSPPMLISGFIIPQQVTGETDAAKLTVFVGEGDIGIQGDYLALTDQRNSTIELWDGITCSNNSSTNPRNVWNGRSTDNPSDVDAGVDLDSFHILWTAQKLKQGDTSATINLHTDGDGYVTIYMILSVRSKITTGGSINYLIR